MREKLAQYVALLFEGAGSCEDIKQEILQNTLDRYDDLIAEGKSPESAYHLRHWRRQRDPGPHSPGSRDPERSRKG